MGGDLAAVGGPEHTVGGAVDDQGGQVDLAPGARVSWAMQACICCRTTGRGAGSVEPSR